MAKEKTKALLVMDKLSALADTDITFEDYQERFIQIIREGMIEFGPCAEYETPDGYQVAAFSDFSYLKYDKTGAGAYGADNPPPRAFK